MSEHKNRGAKRARIARAELDLGGAPLVDVVTAVESTSEARVLVLELSGHLAGAFINRPGLPLLVVNGNDTVERQRFTVAHEFGHHWIGHGSRVDRVEFHGYDSFEVEANSFASEFLMPRACVCAWGEEHVEGPATLEHVVRMAAHFGVSAPAARIALATAGVERDKAVLTRLDDEIREGEHLPLYAQLGLERLDDQLLRAGGDLPRLPGELEGTAFGDLLAGRCSVLEYADVTGRSVAEVEDLLRQTGLEELLGL